MGITKTSVKKPAKSTAKKPARRPSALDKRFRVAAKTAQHTSKLFRTGGSLAVRIPNAWALGKEGDAVCLVRRGDGVEITPADAWPAEVLAVLGSWRDEPPLERIPDQPIAEAFRKVL